jgi:hypothetical protein
MYTDTGLTASQAATEYPVLRALPHFSRSSRYEHIPTVIVLKALEESPQSRY